MAFLDGVRANHEIGEDAAGAGNAVPPSAHGVSQESQARRAPDNLVELPINRNPRVLEESVQKRFIPIRKGQQFSEDRSRDS